MKDRTLRVAPLVILIVVVALVAGYVVLQHLRGGAGEATMNVIIVSADTLRADHLGCYGYARGTSPRIDRLARQGVLFEHAVAQASSTLPSHSSIFTSRFPSQHRAVKDRFTYTDLAESETTLAEILRQKGYRTAAFTGGGEMAKVFNLDQGFEVYDDSGGGILEVGTRALDWLGSIGKERFLLFVHFYDTHYPYVYVPRPEGALRLDHEDDDTQRSIACYDSEISHVDDLLGRFLSRLEAMGLGDDTLLVFTSDHGEEFGEHSGFRHGSHVHDELILVPLIMRGGPVLAGVRVPDQVSSIDISPTILDVLGLEIPDAMMGRSLLPLLVGGSADEVLAFSENEKRTQLGVRSLAGKLILGAAGRLEYYDLGRDPGEHDDLAAGDRYRVPEAFRLLEAAGRWGVLIKATAQPDRPEKQLSPMKDVTPLDQLRGLGYIK